MNFLNKWIFHVPIEWKKYKKLKSNALLKMKHIVNTHLHVF
jgi:hypothetical protein